MASCKMTGARIIPLAVMLSSVGQRAADQHSWAVCGAADCSVLRFPVAPLSPLGPGVSPLELHVKLLLVSLV